MLGAIAVSTWPDLDWMFTAVTNIFTGIFFLELIVKVYFFRMDFVFVDGTLQKFNLFDTLIVLASAADLWIISPLMGAQGQSSSSSLQVWVRAVGQLGRSRCCVARESFRNLGGVCLFELAFGPVWTKVGHIWTELGSANLDAEFFLRRSQIVWSWADPAPMFSKVRSL